jgi:transmembrane sensor
MSTGESTDVRRTVEASRWFARLRDEPDNEEVLNGWLRWCEAHPDNPHAFERLQRLWRQTSQAFPDSRDIDALLQPGKVRPPPPRSRRLWLRYSAVLAAATGCAVAWLALAPPRMSEEVLQSVRRENRTATLPDGSAVELSAKTSVAVDFSNARRSLRLSQGEAYFRVAPDKARPFTVRAGDLEVTAVGTVFDVKQQPHRIDVTVQEGVVAVRSLSPDDSATLAGWRVTGGYQFTYSDMDATATLTSIDTSAVLAWRDGRLEYARTSLVSVIADVNRYAQHPVEMSPELAKLTFTGTVFTDSIDGWISALPGAFPVEVRRTADGTVHLVPRQGSAGRAVAP